MPVGREVDRKKPEKAAAKKTNGTSKPERGSAAKAKSARAPAKKVPAKKAPTTKAAGKPKAPAPKAVARKTAAKKAPAKPKAPAPKAVAKKSAAKKAPAANTVAAKTLAAKTTASKSAAKKAPAPKKPAGKAPKKQAPAKAPAGAAKKPSTSRANGASSAPPPRPSERAMAVSAQVPVERALTDEEREAMAKVALTAKRFLSAEGTPAEIVARIGTFIDEVRSGKRPEPKSNDVRLGLGVLWGDQVRAQVGWRWVHLTYGHLDFASYALVPDDRAFACFPLNRIPDLMTAATNTSTLLFEKIRAGELPPRRDNAYLVIG